MRKLSFAFAAVLVALAASAPAFAQTVNHPWEADERLLEATEKGIKTGGILSVRSHVDELEKALAGSTQAIDLADKGEGDTRYVLTDGQQDVITQLGAAVASGGKGKTVAVANPYPAIAFYLGSYYDEIGRQADAVRVIEMALALPNTALWQSRPQLLVERGAALGQINRHADALASYDLALATPDLPARLRAASLRGRGFNLTDLGRLDEAEAAYRESLNVEPGNRIATNELAYIAKLKAGASATQPTMTKIQPGKSAN